MANPNLIIALGKVIVAAAWADGEIDHSEVNSLKDLLFRLPRLNATQWAELDMYIETPIDEAERARLVENLRRAIGSSSDQTLAIEALHEVIEADGNVNEDEQRVLREIEDVIRSKNVSIVGGLSGLVKGAISRRSDALADAPNREEYFEDFVKNKVYYEVQRRLNLGDDALNIPEDKLRKLSLAGGLMAQVARVNSEIDEGELQTITRVIQDDWHISQQEAAFVAEVATSKETENIDYFRVARQFTAVCSHEERIEFLDVLFDIAASDGMASNDEIEEIRGISKSLLLSHQDFIQAKVKLPREQRAS